MERRLVAYDGPEPAEQATVIAAATGMMWLVGCAGVLGWAALVLVGAPRDPSMPSRSPDSVVGRPRHP